MKDPVDVHKVFAEYFKGYETLAYALSAKLADGNICLDIEAYKKELPNILNAEKAKEFFNETDSKFWVSPEDFELQIEGEYVANNSSVLKPFVILNGQAYLQRYFTYETQIIDNIRRLGNCFHIITGGPGSGKTYSVSTKLVELFRKNINLKVALAAPTGKAAARMNESIKNFAESPENGIPEKIKTNLTGLKAQTIHRLLGYMADSVFFRHDEKNRLPFDVVIIDECSMVDGAMMAKLLNAMNDNTELYLLGDKDQLASVEAGSVFGDLCRAGDTVLLKKKVDIKVESFRFKPNEGIGKFSKEVIDGTFSDVKSYSNDNQITIELLASEDPKTNLFKERVIKSGSFKKYALEYQEYIYEDNIGSALKSLNKVRFLCVTRDNDYSVAATNKAIERLLKETIADKEKFDPKEGFYHNQPVIITQNDYKLNIFNGDVGIIRRDGDVLVAYFETSDGEIRKIPAGYLNHFETVFAMTIHKSQGSEFDHVVVILPEKQGEKLLTRELLYTGVTRAKTNVLLMTSEQVLRKCVERSVSRASGLEERLKNIQG